MPQLKCMVKTCAHNQNCLCSLDSISVGGNQAKTAEETCCDSFKEKTQRYTNSMKGDEKATETCSVTCQANDCVYNKNCRCQAGNVNVQGTGACNCSQTKCATFSCQCK